MSALCVHCERGRRDHRDLRDYKDRLGSCPIYKDGKFAEWHPVNRFKPRSEPSSDIWTAGKATVIAFTSKSPRSEEQVMSDMSEESFEASVRAFDEQIDTEAMRLFRMLHGPGDSGSEMEYRAQNPALIEGWERLAVESLRRLEKRKYE